jgi:soluble lytic murein transglycosylase-like protein
VNRATFGLFAAVVLTAAGCVEPPPSSTTEARLAVLERAFAARDSDPETAADLFEEAGFGAVLEAARMDGWYLSLRRLDAGSDHWRAILAARPPARIEARATLALAEALVEEGDPDGAAVVLAEAPETVRRDADLALIELGDPRGGADAALRLALDAPHLLRSRSPTLEREVLRGFDHDDWMRRTASWRAAGLGSRGAAELRGQRRRGDEEKQRRIELARCELDAGSTSRALSALPSGDRADSEELALRAEAYRRRGWNRVPDASAVRSFRSCVDLATQSAARAPGPVPDQTLALILECGTESGRLEEALEAWWRLEGSGWGNSRRSWLGRRLGVALARSGGHRPAVNAMASSLTGHERCLSYWQAASDESLVELAELAQTAVADIYGRWARDAAGIETPEGKLEDRRVVGVADPPSSVEWLLDHADVAAASDEWQRLRRARRLSRGEALAATELAARAGRPTTAIRTLRSAFPELSSVAIADAPADAVEAYLPLRWPDHLLAAAHETGLDPWLIAAVARQESVFAAHARSPAGARGVLQLLPGTARLHSRALGLGSRPDLEDPAINIRLGAHELAWLIRRFGAIEPALAAYNAGERRVRRWWRRWPDARVFSESIPIPETYTYVRRVVFLSEGYRRVHDDVWRDSP